MSKLKLNFKKVMAEVEGIMSLEDNGRILPRKILEEAIMLSIGSDPRTIDRYIKLMLRFKVIERGANQYVFKVPAVQRRL